MDEQQLKDLLELEKERTRLYMGRIEQLTTNASILLPDVAEVQKKLLDKGPRGQFVARSDVEDILDVVRELMEARS